METGKTHVSLNLQLSCTSFQFLKLFFLNMLINLNEFLIER